MDVEPLLEGAPTDDQKERLESFLVELMLLSRKYQILLHDREETAELLDIRTGRLIGMGLAWFTAPDDDCKVLDYVPVDSILDGTWLMDVDEGFVEQRHVQNVFPVREL